MAQRTDPGSWADFSFDDEPTQLYQPGPPSAGVACKVAFSADDIRETTLPQLRRAYLTGELATPVYVLQEGSSIWQSPAELFGAQVLPQSQAPAPVQRSVSSVAPRSAVGSARMASVQPVGFAQSVRPVVVSEEPMVPAPASRAPALLLAVAFLAGTLVTLQRQGLLYQWAKAEGLGQAYERFESRVLGGPGRETPRGLERYLANNAAQRAASAPLAGSGERSSVAAPVASPSDPESPLGLAEPQSPALAAAVDPSELEPAEPASKDAEQTKAIKPQASGGDTDAPGLRKAALPAEPIKPAPAAVERAASPRPRQAASKAAPPKPAARASVKAAPAEKEWKRNGVTPASQDVLNSAIRGAVSRAKNKPKTKTDSAAEFDPLNPKLD